MAFFATSSSPGLRSLDDAVDRALAIATNVGEARLEAMTNFRLGQVYEAIGDYRLLEQAVTERMKARSRRAAGAAT